MDRDVQVRRLMSRLRGTRRVFVLYGLPGSGRSALAEELAHEAGATLSLPVHWLSLGVRTAAPERLVLRLLLTSGAAQTELGPALLSTPEVLAGLAAAACQNHFRAHPAVIVLDDLPEDTDGKDLLRTAVRLLENTGCVLIATTTRAIRTSNSDRSGVTQHQVDLTPEAYQDLLSTARRAPALLRTLAVWEGAEFSPDMTLPVEDLSPAEWREAVEGLHQEGLLQQARPGWYELRPALRAQLVPDHTPDELRSDSQRLDSALSRAVPREPGALGDAAEPYVDLALRLCRSREANSREFTTWLAHQLVGEGALLPLLMLRAGLGHAAYDRDILRVPLAAAVRQTGQPQTAAEALAGIDTPDAIRELALARHHMGQLDTAEVPLDALPADLPDGWALHTRASIRTDRGELREVGRLLRRAIETHQVHGDRRGEAWAVFHYGRWRLMCGDPEEALKRFETARFAFRDVGDVVGAAWTSTELCRAELLLNGARTEVMLELKATPLAHREHGDVRGEAWATLLQGVAYADADLPGSAAHVLLQTLRLFESVPDRLGIAWTRHHLAWLTKGDRTAALRRVLDAFDETGCLNGPAWTLLLQGPGRAGADRAQLDEAQSRFEALDDTAGVQWVAVVRDGPGSSRGARAVRALTSCYPRPVLKNMEWDDFDTIPLMVHHLLPETAASPDGAPPGEVSPAAFVRLALLDDSPATGGEARIVLRVEPGREYSGATSEELLPPLTAWATPLTHADVDPTHSVPVNGTALFRFTPYQPGRHRIRFTIEDAESNSVLQQVETEIEVIGTTGTAPVSAAPQPMPTPAFAQGA
ncbi:ATP-binding protein [Streptomyces sp. NBC_00304]|uniref:ATP-binding protein n=1 Tax=Streptomyces sp. NBC_00304 TaxID=2975706 RepID=UPI002E2BE4F4|nr:ATP-binding protein [Streptomyces sp. NBC_00304]